jgi:hypothetical protein
LPRRARLGWRAGEEIGALGFPVEIHLLYLDQSGVNFPVANALELGELFLRRFDRLFSAWRRSNDNRALAAAEEPIVYGNLIHETYAIIRHPSRSQSS